MSDREIGSQKSEAGEQGPGAGVHGPGFVFVELPDEFSDESALVVRVPRSVRSKEKLLRILADKLRLPGYFGGNWDALEDALRDLTWLPAGQRVVIVHVDLPFGAGGENRAIYLSVLERAAEHWAANGQREFRVVLPGAARVVLPNAARG